MYESIETYNKCGCKVEVEIDYDCECCGTGYKEFTFTPCETHSPK